MKRRTFIKQTTATGAVLAFVPEPLFRAFENQTEEALADNFINPPASSRTRTWWHWMNGNVTKEGITLDLEAMHRIGVGGFQIFDVGTGITQGPIVYLSDEWLDLMQHTAKEAERLGLAFEMHNCPGWSSSGGPWITPENSMQRLVWTESFVTGGQMLNVDLPQPYKKLGYYRDAFILAFPSLAGETQSLRDQVINVKTDKGPADIHLLTNGDLSEGISFQPEDDQPAYLQFEFAGPYASSSIEVLNLPLIELEMRGSNPSMDLEISDDGVHFRKICEVPGGSAPSRGGAEIPSFAQFESTQARFYRLVIPGQVRITDIRLAGARIPGWIEKSNLGRERGGFNAEPAEEPSGTDLPVPSGSVIDPESVIDITGYVNENGRLSWEAPEGNWTILRIGHTPTGITNNAAPTTGLGLECDKFSRKAYEFHFSRMFSKLLPSLGTLASKGMVGSIIDSYEVSMQNWTVEYPQEFRQRCGYSLVRYMPAMTGRIVGNMDISDRFLWDVRRSQADLMADNYYGCFAEVCRQNGMKSYAEPYGSGPFDEMQCGSRVDIAMGEYPFAGGGDFDRQVKMAASCAHLYGRSTVGAEAYTGVPERTSWQEYPYSMKGEGDWMYTHGLNQFIFHRFAHQPHPSAMPGMTMGPWGFCFERTNTWWNQGKAWLDYAGRCQYMLQQGTFVADVLYCVPEDAPTGTPSRGSLEPGLPDGYDYDTVNQETILNRLDVDNGRIVLPDGMSYKILVLQDDRVMTLELLKKIRDLVEKGLYLVGPKPERTPNLRGYPESERELQQIAGEVWGNLDGITLKERTFGRGRVFWGLSMPEIMDELDLSPDFTYSGRSADAPVHFIHRRVGDNEIYFVANRRRSTEEVVCTFRVEGKHPELWNPETGERTRAVVFEISEGRTKIPLKLDPAGSVFVVFRSPAETKQIQSVAKEGVKVISTDPFPAVHPGLYPDVTNNFTVNVRVKPEVSQYLPAKGEQARASGPGGAVSCVYYPPEGGLLYGGGHAATGLMAGRNGIALLEREKGYPLCVMFSGKPLEGWTNISVVYENGRPLLYVNGELIERGERSGHTVHPGIGESYIHDGGYGIYFLGHAGEPELIPEALSADRIRDYASGPVPEPVQPPVVDIAYGSTSGLRFWQNGEYMLTERNGSNSIVKVSGIGEASSISTPWRVQFPPGLGAPGEIILPELMSLRKHADEGVKYFSGTATYSNQFNVKENLSENGKRIFLDLGWVEVFARVRVNGQDLGILWKPPFRIDITDAVERGDNLLEVDVTDLWLNRLIGDEHLPAENEYEQYGDFGGGSFGYFGKSIKELPDWYKQGRPKPAGGRVTFATWQHYTKDDPLVESGLLGPVILRTAFVQNLDM